MKWRSVARTIIASGLMGAAIGLPILGIGGRSIMRVIAHWEGRVPVLTIGGTLRVLFVATMAGLAAGAVHGVLQKVITNNYFRIAVFLISCVAFTWKAVNALLPRPRLLFVALTVVYVIVFEFVTAKREKAKRSKSEVNPAFAG